MNSESQDEIKNSKGSVHLLLVGQSKGHISKVLEIFEPTHIDLFTTTELFLQVSEFITSMNSYHGTHHVCVIPSFRENSIYSGISIIYSRYKNLKSRFPGMRIYFGITGGTNTMAVEMALTAVMTEESIHYVVKDSDNDNAGENIILFNTEELNKIIKNGTIGGGR
jgi:hypothetical protein